MKRETVEVEVEHVFVFGTKKRWVLVGNEREVVLVHWGVRKDVELESGGDTTVLSFTICFSFCLSGFTSSSSIL